MERSSGKTNLTVALSWLETDIMILSHDAQESAMPIEDICEAVAARRCSRSSNRYLAAAPRTGVSRDAKFLCPS